MAKNSNTSSTINTQSTNPPGSNTFVDLGSVSSNQYDYILSYFENVADNRDSAKQLAGAVVHTAKLQGLNPMTVLEEFRKIPKGEMSLRIALFLNESRFGSSYLGLKSDIGISPHVSRTILQ